jgi:type III pantothenate kinase
MLVVADIGNARAKVGLCREGIVRQVAVAATPELAQALEQVDRALCSGGAEDQPQNVQVAFCSVVAEAEQTLTEWAAREGRAALAIRGDSRTPLVNRYRDPARLGGDRLAAAVGAAGRFDTPVVVVSLGTAAVMDAVSADGEFLGGAIAPGLQTGLRALADGTSGLPLLEPAEAGGPIGADTEGCLRAGVVHGMAAWIEGMAARMRGVVGPGAHLAVTGGDADLVAPHLRIEHSVIPGLTLEGVAAVWEHNRGRVGADR